MRKIRGLALLFLVMMGGSGCSTLIVKPEYIDPEADLVRRLNQNYKTIQKHPTKPLIEQTLADAQTYYKRMNYKVQKNNTRSF